MTQAKTITVTAPNAAYRGTHGYGENAVTFADGKAEVAANSPLLRYFREAGYDIEGEKTSPDPAAAAPAPAQTYPEPGSESIYVGTPLRDAAVDPRPEDYLEPVGAGTAHPHSADVVSPGIHGVGPAPIRPGDVFVDDPARQERAELALAAKVLRDGEPATIVAADFDPGEPGYSKEGDGNVLRVKGGNMGPQGLSDPGSVAQGQKGAAAASAAAGAAPGGNAKKAEWVDFAVARGADRDAAEDLTIAQLRERYG